ncbi:hypothetical protein [Isoptericola jiangsuensis]|uniref:hypothetical protein n=1 Tax=Isoptericola jiangsuensis TaxID=548579 RepID=UPI000BF9EBCC|nr:hypothetical protein [Isoptericola jiangsuensis]
MHVLLVTADDASADLAALWSGAAPRCTVDGVVLPPPSRTVHPGPDVATAPAGVFVPTTALGLGSVTAPPVPTALARLHEQVGAADLVVVHVAVLDTAALHDGPVAEAARAAAPHAVPVVVLTGEDRTTRRALAAAGVAGAHDVGDPVDPGRVARVARTWCPAPRTDATGPV